jgi:2',3'-cyclic-nucleotide 2'-phosphodiesterase (5'-nucleotidase family)
VGGSRFLGFRHGGVKVAIVGLTNSVSRDRMGRAVPKDVIIPEPKVILKSTMEKLSGKCDMVIVLSDLDLQEAIGMAQEIKGIDLFFVSQGGKEKHTEKVGETIFIYPVRNGNELGDVELVLDEEGAVTSYQVEWTLLDKSVPDDDELGQLIAEYKAEMTQRNKPPQAARK